MSDRLSLLQAILRSDLVSFVEKCFATLEPGAPYLDNWHIHAIAHQLMRVWRGESKRFRRHQPGAALSDGAAHTNASPKAPQS
jgi:hypothetical protein